MVKYGRKILLLICFCLYVTSVYTQDYDYNYEQFDYDYFIYGKTEPTLLSVDAIATYYNWNTENLLYTNFYKSDYLNEENKDFIIDWQQQNDSLIIILHTGKKNIYPLEKGDTILLPYGSITELNRAKAFERFEQLFVPLSDSLGSIGQDIPKEISDYKKTIPFDLYFLLDEIPEPLIELSAMHKIQLTKTTQAFFVDYDDRIDINFYTVMYIFREDKQLHKPILLQGSFRDGNGAIIYEVNYLDWNHDGFTDILRFEVNDYIDYTNPGYNQIHKKTQIDLFIWTRNGYKKIELMIKN